MGLFKEIFHTSRKSQVELSGLLGYTQANLSLLKTRKVAIFAKLEKAMSVLKIPEITAREGNLEITVKYNPKRKN